MPEESFLDSLISTVVAALALPLSTPETWDVTFQSRNFGPLQTQLIIEQRWGGAYARSPSGLDADLIPGLRVSPDGDIFAVDLEHRDGGYEGELVVTNGGVNIAIKGNTISGEVGEGWLQGPFEGTRGELSSSPIRNYPTVADEIFTTLRNKLFDPGYLDDPAFVSFEETLRATAETAQDDFDFALAFDLSFPGDRMSHVSLRRSDSTAEEFMAFADTMRTGRDSARLSWRNNVAVLTVDTMMGLDTIEQIDAAYDAVAAATPDALIIDLRDNPGGAFAVKPLVEHVISEPLRVGVFASQAWAVQDRGSPGLADTTGLAPWQGWSIQAFWRDVQDAPLTVVEFTPAETIYSGPVYVLVGDDTESAAELAADAFKAAPNVTVVGHRTAGKMLSQMALDVGGGFQLSLPIADYYSLEHGRIEGAGVTPDIQLGRGDDAMAYVLRQMDAE